ncbi:PREDICTED: pentatricopeptide repeat-containing protein At5g15340, mitochondrial [Theobroma cacao]|uniref:Pentatricopeptide repeat-containing protein At5g15340, mitochondrial n=1 Tax=Theobroma cacao TaxID=3641 RepID=A0AB32V6C6_THECC|nr:PREDICTED: pentatricopeptide repeat-containing protein At5g15340, mitochondrial [Theobroma cacao]
MKWPILQAFPSFSPRYLRPFLRLCARQSALTIGKKLHALVLTTGVYRIRNSFLLNALLHLYASCGDTPAAHKLFDEIPPSSKDTADWTALMSSFSRDNMPLDALHLFAQMRGNSMEIDDVVMVCLFSACAWLRDVGVGSQVHGCVVKTGFQGRVKVCNAVMDMYGKCGMVGEMRKVFGDMKEKSVVSWTVLLDGVLKWEGVRSGRVVFDEMPERNEVAWTIMIVGYMGSGLCREGFSLLSEMMFHWGFKLNHVTLCSLLSACAQSGDVLMGGWVHVYGLKMMGMEMDIMVGTALVDMYSKCGRVDTAVKVFECMPRRNLVAWNAMLSGLAMHGRGRVVVEMFPRMIEEVKPDDLTFIAVLSACSHSGLVDQGSCYFDSLESVYGITPKIDHYACMVDLLGRAGRLEEAETLIKQMPIAPNEVVLGSLLGSCSAHGKLQLGEHALQRLIEMDPHNTEYHILLSNMYALAGKRDQANALRTVLKTKGIRKVPGMSSIHVDGQVHQFSAGDKSHSKTQDIYLMLDNMIQRLRSAGYVPNTASQVFSGSDGAEDNARDSEEKEQALFLHSEKLAVCFGLLSTKPGTPLYIFKNLRICQDCHAALKIVSKIYNRKVVVRDRNRFHYFKQGSCSCCDFW